MRAKVVDQMGSGLAALYRMSVSVRAADNSTVVPIIPNKNKFAAIEDGDLEQVRRLLQLTSLPFHNSYEDDLQELMNMLQVYDHSIPTLVSLYISVLFQTFFKLFHC